jgi:hypothetical protein
MSTRTTERELAIRSPFRLSGTGNRLHPAGTYRVVIDEQEISDQRGNLDRLAFHRAAVFLHTPAIGSPGAGEIIWVAPGELDQELSAE